MALRKILTDGDPALHKMCRPVTSFDARLHTLLDDLKESAVLRTCMRLRRSLEGWLAQPPFRDWELTVLGPAPASVAKINDRYRYRLTLAAQNTKEIRAMVAHLVRCAQTDKENKGVSVSADVNPLD